METIKSSEQCLSIIRDFTEQNKRVLNNTPLLPDDIERYVNRAVLSYEKYDRGLVFFCKEHGFDKLFLYVDESFDSHIDRNIGSEVKVIEIVFSSRRINARTQAMFDLCERIGFEQYAENIRLRTKSDADIPEKYLPENWSETLSWRYAGVEDKDFLFNVWSHLDPYASLLPSDEELQEMADAEELVMLCDDGRPCCVTRMKEENSKTVSFWLVAVDPAFQGRGLVSRLYAKLMLLARERGYENVAQWTDVNNARMLRTASQFGFTQDAYVSREYIMK